MVVGGFYSGLIAGLFGSVCFLEYNKDMRILYTSEKYKKHSLKVARKALKRSQKKARILKNQRSGSKR